MHESDQESVREYPLHKAAIFSWPNAINTFHPMATLQQPQSDWSGETGLIIQVPSQIRQVPLYTVL